MDFKKEANRIYWENETGRTLAEVTFPNINENVYSINHTYVLLKHRNQKVGERLIRAVVDQARSENKKIHPQCSFAVKEFLNKKEYADVWDR